MKDSPPPQTDKPTLRDVVNGTPKGQQAVDKALKRSAKHQAEVSRQAQTEQIEEQFWRVLADYSYDLSELKKRNGKLPAEAAVERLKSILTASNREARIDELERVDIIAFSHAKPIREQFHEYLQDRLAKLRTEVRLK